MKNKEVSGLQGASQNVGYKIYKQFYLKEKLMCCQVTWVRLIARSVLECRPVCPRSCMYALDRK